MLPIMKNGCQDEGKNVLFPGFSDRSDDIADHAYDKRTSNHGYQGVNKKHLSIKILFQFGIREEVSNGAGA